MKDILIAITEVMPKDEIGNIIDKALHSDIIDAVQKVKNCSIPDVSQRSELLAFKYFISKTPLAELEYYSDEEFTDLYLKANCG